MSLRQWFSMPSAWGLCWILSISGCASVSGVRTGSLDGRAVEHVVAGQGTPVAVFENGLDGRLQWWAKVLPEVAKETTVFAYNRAGTGSSAASTQPLSGDEVVDGLRRNLRAVGLAPPYVLVGHSLGGLYMQLYARRYPQEVAGLVLVDSTHPEQLKGAGALENWPAWFRWTLNAWMSEASSQELAALSTTGSEVLALPPISGKPVLVLSALRPMGETSELARDSNAKRMDIARLYPGSKQVWVDSGHVIPLEKPEAVIAAIREVVASVRAVGVPVSPQSVTSLPISAH